MSIDVFNESVITFSEASKLLPRRRRGCKVHPSCIYRWYQAGLRSASGMIVRLEIVQIGGTKCTSKEALQRFFDRLQDRQLPEVSPEIPTMRTRSKQMRETERKLRMMGLDGDANIFQKSTVSKERLCDLHEYVEQKMPGKKSSTNAAYLAVRSGIFEHAVRILEGKAGNSRSIQTAMEWIDSLDLLTLDVRQLYGVGPLYESQWKALLQDPNYQDLQRRKSD